jgi:hypothetical protein
MKPTYHYTTVLEALADLKKKDFTMILILIKKPLRQIQMNFLLSMFIVMKVIRILMKNLLFME